MFFEVVESKVLYMLVRSIISPFSNGKKKIGKDPDAGKYWRQEEMGTTEDEMVGWHHRFSGHEFEWTPGVGDGQRGLVCCSQWGHKESDTTEQLNWTDWEYIICSFIWCRNFWGNISVLIYAEMFLMSVCFFKERRFKCSLNTLIMVFLLLSYSW